MGVQLNGDGTNALGAPAQYTHVRRLGSGAEGGTWAATDRGTGRPVVLKRVAPDRLHVVRRAFEVLRSSASPHLPAPRALTPSTQPDGSFWLVTDFVEGEPLAAARVDPAVALAESLAVAHALAAIHRADTHHGDVAPGNVIVTGTGGVMVVDLGQLGQHGTGTPGFIAPEVLAGGGGPAADRFALGSLLCLRLYGEVPWKRPEALVALRDLGDVRRRLAELSGDPPIPRALQALLELLLHPDPQQRIAAPDLIVARLGSLVRAAEDGVDLAADATWWIPQRWPYRYCEGGIDVRRLAGTLGRDTPRVIAVAGPAGVGRRRVVEELVQHLQLAGHGPGALACEPDVAGALLGQPSASWIEAWCSAAQDSVVGLVTEPQWPSLGPDTSAHAADRSVRARAALLLEAAGSAKAIVVVPVGQQLGRVLEQAPPSRASGPAAVQVVHVRPWDPKTVGHALDEVLHCSDRSDWVDVLVDATGGWPGRVVRAVAACAAVGLDAATPAGIERALQSMPDDAVLGMDEAVALDVLQAGWGDGDALRRLPSHLHDSISPRAHALAGARHRLGARIQTVAQATLDAWPADLPVSLSLAVDAGSDVAIEAALLRDHALPVARAGAEAVLTWLEHGSSSRVSDQAVAVACRGLLAEGNAERALELAIRYPQSAPCQLQAARASQRLGRSSDAERHLEYVVGEGSPDERASARGLGWRLLVDRGEAETAANEARRCVDALPSTGLGAATARLWGAMALLVAGDDGLAEAWLEQADAAVAPWMKATETAGERTGSAMAAAAGLRARVSQLRGNVGHAAGDCASAQQHYAAAAAAFLLAEEAVGGLLVRGSLAGLAVSTYCTTAGIEEGRWALRGLIARGQRSATLEAALNLVQLLTRVGADEQARAVASLAEALFAARRHDDRLVRGRLSRIDAELAGRRRGGTTVEDAMVAAAVDLSAAGVTRESVEAWIGAASAARRAGALSRASAHLASAVALRADDSDSQAWVAVETLALSIARGEPGHSAAIARGLDLVRTIGSPAELVARGRLDLAWAVARSTALGQRQRCGRTSPETLAATRQLVFVVERIMQNTDPNDRAAVRGTLTEDPTERAALRELLSDLDDEPVAPPTAQPAAVPADLAGARLHGLLRVYRRLAREDRLEHLLEQVVDAMMELTDAERGAVVVNPMSISDEEGVDVPRIEVTRELAAGGEGVRFSRSIIERVLTEGEPVLSVDAAHDDRFDGSRSISHLNLRSVLAVPLRFRGELFGAAYVDHRLRRGAFDEGDLSRMEEFADLAALAVAHARALAGLRAQAAQLSDQGERLARLLEAREAEVEGLRVQAEASTSGGPRHGMVGSSVGMKKVFRLIDRLADADVPVVIHGESGTGKELVARAIHDSGPRADQQFIAENCGAIPETLVESVLFGHARGAFTGAAKSRAGLFEAANGGTIFLDEVGEMSPGMQTKLLRVLQEGEVRRIGETHPRDVDVRVIAASNRDLDAMVKDGTFRRDLYYRIHVVKLVLPPLREREGDLPALVAHLASRRGRSELTVSPAAMRVLCAQPWPGNVRELDNEVQRWIALCDGEIAVEDLSPTMLGAAEGPDGEDLQIRPRVDRLERDLIERALERTGGNQTKAAVLLGLSRFGLQKKLRRMADPEA